MTFWDLVIVPCRWRILLGVTFGCYCRVLLVGVTPAGCYCGLLSNPRHDLKPLNSWSLMKEYPFFILQVLTQWEVLLANETLFSIAAFCVTGFLLLCQDPQMIGRTVLTCFRYNASNTILVGY